MGVQSIHGLALALGLASGMFACSSGPAPVGGPGSDPNVTPADAAVTVNAPRVQTNVGPQGRPYREMSAEVESVLEGLIQEEDHEVSHVRRLVAAEPWGNRAFTRPFQVVKPSRTDIDKARRTRRARRAFDGAPPVMGHSLQFGGEHSCLHCHGVGMTIGNRVARPMSHAELPNCTQCHIEARNEWLDESTMPANDFVGWWNPENSERAAQGAPPTIPHHTFLRTSCLSCHGEFGYEGLRTNHPERANCLQCHVERK